MSILKLSKVEADPELAVKKKHLTAKANELEYHLEIECMKPLFEADLAEIEQIQDKWVEQLQANKDTQPEGTGLKLADMLLNINFVGMQDSKDFKMKLRDVRCKICFGLTRLPGTFCGSCRRIYCRTCLEKQIEDKGADFKCPN